MSQEELELPSKFTHLIKKQQYDNIKKLQEKISPYIIIRKKEDCLELPENYIIKTYCSLDDENLLIISVHEASK